MTTAKPDTRIVQRGRGHSYLLDGQKVPGVTRELDQGVPKPQLVDWAASQSAKYAVDHWDELLALPPSERLEAIRGARWSTLRQAGERGREVHELVHRYIIGEPVSAPDDLVGHFDAARRFVDDWQVEEIAVEVAVFHRANPDEGRPHPYGGRFDLLARLADQLLWLLDFKTSLRGVFKEYALQLTAYRYADFYILDGELDKQGAAVEHPMPPVDRSGVVWLSADGSYELTPLETDHAALEAFTAAQQLAAFARSERDDWIGSPLRPPGQADDEAAA
jgi:hypothetical protein